MPLHGTHEQLQMTRMFNKFLSKNLEITPENYYNKYSIDKIEYKIKKFNNLISFLNEILDDMYYVDEYDDILDTINNFNENSILEKSQYLIYDLDGYAINLNNNNYRNWVYKYEIDSYIKMCNNNINSLEKALTLHNISSAIELALIKN